MHSRRNATARVVTRRHSLVWLGASAAAVALPLRAQIGYPSRPVELVVCYGPGGTSDMYYRGLGTLLSRYMGQPFVIVNRPGAGSAIGTAQIKRSAPDGYTVGNLTEVMMRERLLSNDLYDPARDFTYIGAAATVPFGWGVRPDSSYRTLNDLVHAARQSPPGTLSYAAAGSAKLPSWAMKVLESQTGTHFLGVPYPSSSAVLVAALSGQVDVICDALGAMAGAVGGGRLRMLAVSSEQRLPQWPDVPTAREQGIDAITMLPYGLGGPAGMPPPVVAALESALRHAAADPGHQQLVDKLNMASWSRIGKPFHDYMQAQYAALPAQMRSFGVATAR